MSEIVPITGWTPERVDELRAYAAAGLTSAQIAHRMRPITELAIIGRATRLGIVIGVKPARTLSARAARKAEDEQSDPMFGAAPPAREDAWLPLPGATPVSLLDREEHQCPWPIGGNDSDGAIACCGVTRPETLPYCRDHTAMAYVSGRYRRPRGEVAQYIRSNERRYA